MSVLALAATNAQNAEECVEEGARAAEEAEKEQEQDTKDHTDDNAGDSAARETGGGLCLSEGAVGAGRDGGLEGHCCGGGAGVCDNNQGRRRRSNGCRGRDGGHNTTRRATSD